MLNATRLYGQQLPFNVCDRPHLDFVVTQYDSLNRQPITIERPTLKEMILPDRTDGSVHHAADKRGQVRSREALVLCWAYSLMIGGAFRPADASIITEVCDQAGKAYDADAKSEGAECMLLPGIL